MKIPAVFMRGGTSKGVFFHARDLPAERAARDELLLRILGSPDPYGRQLDGMGGGISSLSKVVIVAPGGDADADVRYTFAQVAVDEATVDYSGNCGNLSAAVGPFAIEEGLIRDRTTGICTVRLHNENTKKIIHAQFQVRDGQIVEKGSLEIAGVAGLGAPITLDFLEPGGSSAASFLPTGSSIERLALPDGTSTLVSLVDATNALVFAPARDFGVAGTELPDALESRPELMARLEMLRRRAGQAMRLPADKPGLNAPKVAMVAPPVAFTALDGRRYGPDEFDIAMRMVSMGRIHRAITLTGAMCLAAAACVEGSVPNIAHQSRGTVRVGHPSGITPASALVSKRGATWTVASTRVYRTARRLMEGSVVLPR
jgi:2-methylaconitate cis-trans-isomerase PrpF